MIILLGIYLSIYLFSYLVSQSSRCMLCGMIYLHDVYQTCLAACGVTNITLHKIFSVTYEGLAQKF